MDILFIADPLERFKIYKDSTYAMMAEAARRGHAVYACEPNQLAWTSRPSRPTCVASRSSATRTTCIARRGTRPGRSTRAASNRSARC